MKLNIANRLTLARIMLIPFFVFFIIYPVFTYEHVTWSRIIAVAIFILAALTDFLDGKIARRRHLVTSFGKFMDPLADKFMVFSAMISMCFSDFIFSSDMFISQGLMRNIFFWATLIVVFRELGITSLRLVVSGKSGVVVAASILGKVKTVSQIVCICMVILEPIIFPTGGFMSLASILIMVVFTLWSGYQYLMQFWSHINPSE